MNCKIILTGLFLPLLLIAAPAQHEATEDYLLVNQQKGSTLGYSPNSGMKLLYADDLAFKDLNRNGKIDIYEDWRKPARERAADLAAQLAPEDIAGLMLHSPLFRIREPNLDKSQRQMFEELRMRYVVANRVASPLVSAKWNNVAQAFVEKLAFGIPVNRSSDPRHAKGTSSEFNAGGGEGISVWPRCLGMAALFDPEQVREFGKIASVEYRCMGMVTTLSPQIDLATEPRWNRFYMTFGESPQLVADNAEAYISGFQYSPEELRTEGGWGYHSVNAMAKHWPGGGSGEFGRDAHLGAGKYAVYPGNNLKDHLQPFVEGAFALKDATGKASAIMPYYTISYGQDPSGQNVANAYSTYLIKDLLRGKYGYDGLVCTDWTVHLPSLFKFEHSGKAYGVDGLSAVERCYLIWMAGCDQFGGASGHDTLMKAYRMGVEKNGEAFMRKRFEESAVRILMNTFRVGLFENPYLSLAEVEETVGNLDFVKAGYEAQLRSSVLLKNKDSALPLARKTKVYLPEANFYPRTFFGQEKPERRPALKRTVAAEFFEVVDMPEQADVAVIQIASPFNNQIYSGSDVADFKRGGNGYIPITLQYRPYEAEKARERSIAFDQDEVDRTRAYKGKRSQAKNHKQLDLVLDTKKAMKGKPVIVILDLYNPTVVAEFESKIDALLLHFGSVDRALCEILSGGAEPSGLLPFQMPANMETVEMNREDVPFDLECHTDTEGNCYDFGFGLNWSGPIQDERYRRYIR